MNRANPRNDVWGEDSRGPNAPCIIQRCTSAPPGKYDGMIPAAAAMRASLPLLQQLVSNELTMRSLWVAEAEIITYADGAINERA